MARGQRATLVPPSSTLFDEKIERYVKFIEIANISLVVIIIM